jgi:amidase
VTQASQSPIANVVDANYTIIARMPKRYLPRDIGWMGGAHERLRRAARDSGPA